MYSRIAGDPVVRPQSEFKVSTPVDKPPSAPFSAPPNVIEQAKMEGIVFALDLLIYRIFILLHSPTYTLKINISFKSYIREIEKACVFLANDKNKHFKLNFHSLEK